MEKKKITLKSVDNAVFEVEQEAAFMASSYDSERYILVNLFMFLVPRIASFPSLCLFYSLR